ncbi:FYN-binding protein 1 [Misgurnus anguillicaudatus]|uniref:FYN-binding protein 1 n=1 Tax=Misgurnus anguillicaudatus TaxID=75329 RepID=UPI003CCF8FE6
MAGIKHLGLPRPLVSQKPGPHEDKNTFVQLQGASVPKIRPLPNVFALGKCPAKPARPPHVNCDVFRQNVSNNTELFPPPPPEDLPITSVTPPPPANFTFLPPPPPMDQLLDDQYDDVGLMNTTSSQDKSSNDFQDSGEETYEDVESSRPERDKEPSEKMKTSKSKEVKKKTDKEEKKRLEQERREKKVQEKREQEARKKFKIEGPIVVLTTVKAKLDRKAGKNKLQLKQGETVEIVRKTGNPKNYWLARNREGNYGFVKPDAVDDCTAINTLNVNYDMEADDK